MKKLLFFVFIVVFSISYSQKKFSTNEIFNTSPLQKAVKVKIISYNINFISEVRTPLPPIGGKIDSAVIKRIIENQKFPISLKNSIENEDLVGIDEMKILNFKETFDLFKLLYNTCGKFPNQLRSVSMCFFPRNAILFYDENDKVFDFLEICFECQRMEPLSEESTEINDVCDNFYSNLEKFFQSKGLQTQFNRRK
ncbi:hypothetical protein EG349_00155 [Chryseobacterium shandongense]|uniref:Uncharacterized protein n=1 Tax=Chryseobacterium shandongense TaxID=1493872 RepID=A0AAD0YBK7_9FLAO|nr:hypothetical protein [Chryseobacterium shandongense]AZA85317.1 hypothetical protein EG349_00155 [Chryseobacterium shandongense]AZA97422.1 hypothetical protein EG353_18630 [Chryseobacterium shandongense]